MGDAKPRGGVRQPIALFLGLILAASALRAGVLVLAATSGRADAMAGLERLKARDVTAAAARFGAAAWEFGVAEDQLAPGFLDGAVGRTPWLGRQYVATRALLKTGASAATAGHELSQGIIGLPLDGLDGDGSLGRVVGSLVARKAHFARALDAIQAAAQVSRTIPDGELARPLAQARSLLRERLAAVAPDVDLAGDLLALAEFLFSEPRKMLVLIQNGSELRPTGGFVGSYAIAQTGPGGFRLTTYADSYHVRRPPEPVKPPEGLRSLVSEWSFRDANWWLDFPTSARAVLRFWEASGQKPVDAVVAIDTVAVRGLVAATGPIRLPSYDETFTAHDLLERLVYLVEVRGGRGAKQSVLSALARRLLERLFSSDLATLRAAGQALLRAANEKHVQLYFPEPAPQAVVEHLEWGGVVRQPADATDLLAVANAMILPSKVNIAMRKRIDYSVTLRPDDMADATVTLSWANSGRFPFPLEGTFKDYVRVYKGPGSTLDAGAVAPDVVYRDAGLPVMAMVKTVPRGARATEDIRYRISRAWADDGDGRVYRLYVFRQPDLQDVPTSVVVRPPKRWRVASVTASRLQRGASLRAKVSGGAAFLTTRLSSDLVLEVRLTRL